MYIPGNIWRPQVASYVQLLFHTNERQRNLANQLVQHFNDSILKDNKILNALPKPFKRMKFSDHIVGAIHDANYNMHLSLSRSLNFRPQKTGLKLFFLELDKVAKFDKYEAESTNPHYSLLQHLRGGPLKVTYKPQYAIFQDHQSYKLFLTLLVSDGTKEKLMILVNYLDSIISDKIDNGIRLESYSKYEADKLHSSLASFTPKNKYIRFNSDRVNDILAEDAYKPDESLVQQLQFDCCFFMASKHGRNLKRIPLPR